MNDSNVFGVSVRAWVTLIMVMTVCVMAACGLPVTEPLYSLSIAVVSFYFGRAVGKNDTRILSAVDNSEPTPDPSQTQK